MKPCIDVKALIEYPSDLVEKIYNTCSGGKKMPILAYLVYSCSASNQELAVRLVRGPWLAQRKLRTSIKIPSWTRTERPQKGRHWSQYCQLALSEEDMVEAAVFEAAGLPPVSLTDQRQVKAKEVGILTLELLGAKPDKLSLEFTKFFEAAVNHYEKAFLSAHSAIHKYTQSCPASSFRVKASMGSLPLGNTLYCSTPNVCNFQPIRLTSTCAI